MAENTKPFENAPSSHDPLSSIHHFYPGDLGLDIRHNFDDFSLYVEARGDRDITEILLELRQQTAEYADTRLSGEAYDTAKSAAYDRISLRWQEIQDFNLNLDQTNNNSV